MVKRLPESWIPPDHILDLRARVGCGTRCLSNAGQRQQRIQATLYHHGCPQRRSLLVGDGPSGSPLSRCPRLRASRSRSRWR